MFVLNGIVWKIKIVPPNYPLLQMPDGNYAVGVCDSNYQLICVNNQLRGAYFKEVLCHEIVHAAMFSYNIQITREFEEFIANFVSRYGQQIIQITDAMFKNIKRGYQ
jgi:hypothetical protein